MQPNPVHLFIISSPLQLINALEARNTLCCDDAECDLIIGLSSEQTNNWQVEVLLGLRIWRNIFRIRAYGVGQPYSLRKLVCQLAIAGPYQQVFIGEPYSFFYRSLAETIGLSNNIVYLDDGFSTLELLKNKSTTIKPRFAKVKSIISGAFNLTPNFEISDKFFSAFPDAFSGQATFNLIGVNRYSWIRTQIGHSMHALETQNTIFILGENLCESNLVSKNTYRKIIEKAASLFKNNKIAYIPHRRESFKKVVRLCDDLGMKRLSMETGVEAGFYIAGITPSKVISLQSTALATLPIIYPKSQIYVLTLFENAVANESLRISIDIKHSYLKSMNAQNLQFLV